MGMSAGFRKINFPKNKLVLTLHFYLCVSGCWCGGRWGAVEEAMVSLKIVNYWVSLAGLCLAVSWRQDGLERLYMSCSRPAPFCLPSWKLAVISIALPII